MVSTNAAAAQNSSESGMTKTTAAMSTTSADPSDHTEHADGAADTSDPILVPVADPRHQQNEDDYAEDEGKDSYTIAAIPGLSSKTVWSEPAHTSTNSKSMKSSTRSAQDADAADMSAHSLHSGRSLSSARSYRSINGGSDGSAKSGGRAASMLARTRQMYMLPTSSGEYVTECSMSLNDVNDDGHGGDDTGRGDRGANLMHNVELDGAPASEEVAGAKNNNGINSSSLNEVDEARMALWGVAARNANNNICSNAGTSSEEQVPKKQPHQAGQGTSESRDREHQQQQVDSSRFYYVSPLPEMSQQQQQQRPQEYTPQINQLAVLFSQAQSLGQKAYDRGQQSYRNFKNLRQGYGCNGDNNGHQRVDDDDDGDGHPEITGGFHGQSHESFFNSAAAANATSYMSDMCSLLIVLIQAPFLWLYFAITGLDYHDRYGNVNLQQTSEGIYGGVVDATTSQYSFASRTSKMSAEEKQERSEVYLEAKEEDGTFFALLSFHHPGLVPLADETVDNVALAQVLGEDTGKTGHTDLAAALNPDGMVLNDSDDDDSCGTGDLDVRSMGSAGLSEAFGDGGVDANRSGRSRNSSSSRSRSHNRSKSRTRSTSVDARARRSRDDDEWEYDITTQKMKRKRKKRGGRRKDKLMSRRGSIGSTGSLDARSFSDALGLEDELMFTRSEDPTAASAHSEPPKVIGGGASTSGSSCGGGVRRGRRRSSVDSFRKVQDTLRKGTPGISSHDGAQVNHDEDVVRPIIDIV